MTRRLVIANTYGVRLHFRLPVIAIDFAAFVPLVIASERSERGKPFPTPSSLQVSKASVAIRSSFKGITDSFTLRVQNDKLFGCFNHRKIRGNPFSF